MNDVAQPSGAGNPMMSRNGKQTICQYACFSESSNGQNSDLPKASSRSEAVIEQIRV